MALALGVPAGCDASRTAAPPIATTAPQPAAPAPPAPPPVTEPAAAPLSRRAYQAELVRVEKVDRALERIAQARAYDALATRLDRAARTTGAVAARLAGVLPPQPAADAHERLVRGLEQLAAGLERTRAAVAALDLCAVPSVLVRLGRLPARTPLRAAGRALRGAGYELASIVPKAVPGQTRRLESGAFAFVEARSGAGVLTVDNGLDVDGVVVLSQGKAPVTSMFVRRHDVAVLGGIPDGKYTAYFTLGMDWDGGLRTFTRRCSFARFDDPMRFETVSTGGGYQYQTYSVTLHGVAGGTASTSGVAPGAFPGG